MRTHLASGCRAAVAGLALLVAAHAPCGAQGVSTAAAARQANSRARGLLQAGAYREADSMYADVLRWVGDAEPSIRADAHFGRAYAAQQRVLSGDTTSAAEARALTATALDGFARARSLSPERLGAAADNNIGVMFRELGMRDSAARYFARAAASPGRDRASYLFNAGREFDALAGESSARTPLADSAHTYYRAALSEDTTRADVLRALLALQLRTDPISAVLETAKRWSEDSATAGVVASQLPLVLALPEPPIAAGRPGRAATREEAAKALVTFVTALPVGRVSPSTFDASTRARLTTAREAHPGLRGPIDAVLDAYAPRAGAATYQEPAEADWWRSSRGTDQRRAWNALLRWLGDCYNAQDAQATAQSFYEASLEHLRTDLNAPWIDRGAMLPLALIYAGRPSGAEDLNRLVASVFNAKGPAISRQDLPRMYDFHLTLATVYAAQNKWSGGGADNAEFQMTRLRETTAQLQQQGKAVSVPPSLLQKLGTHYAERGDTVKAASVTRELREDFRRRGKPASDADSVIAHIARPIAQRSTPNVEQVASFRRIPTAIEPPPPQAVKAAAVVRVESVALSGQVTARAGAPKAPHVWVVTPERRVEVPVAADGKFTARVPAKGSFVLHVEAAGFVARDVTLALPVHSPVMIALQPSRRRE